MGSCAGKVLATPISVRSQIPKRYDVFVSCTSDPGAAKAEQQDLSQHFACWVVEVCKALGLTVFMDKANLYRIVDDTAVKDALAVSRVVVAIISRAAASDDTGVLQDLAWAEKNQVPAVAFYDADRHSFQERDAWERRLPYAFRQPAVGYQRLRHAVAKDQLASSLNELLVVSYKGQLPPQAAERLSRQAERSQRRQRRLERRAKKDKHETIADSETGLPITGDHNTITPKRPFTDLHQVELDVKEDEKDGKHLPAVSARSSVLSARSSGGEGKRFRFKDDDVVGTGNGEGIGRLLKALLDPLGKKEQSERLSVLTNGGGVDHGHFEPRHKNAKPARSILKGGRASAGGDPQWPDARPAANPSIADPRLEKGLARLREFLEGLKKEDVAHLPTVIRILELAYHNLEVASKSMAVLFEFVNDTAMCRQTVAKEGGVKVIVAAMTAHPKSAGLQTYGCGCIYALSCYRADNPEKDNNSAAIAHAGGIARVIKAMDSFPMCREVQQWGAGALRFLAVEIGSNRREINDGGEVQLTMRGINKRMIAKVGGIERIARAMLAFPEDLEIQENGCAALCNLIQSRQDAKVRAARAGCIKAAVNALRAFERDPEIAQLASALLRSLALGVPENRIAIAAQGGTRRLCQAMALHRHDPDVNIQSVAALCNLTSQAAENKRAIIDNGGLELTIAALREVPSDPELQRQGCGLLHNLACERNLKPQVVAAGAMQVAEAARTHEERTVQSIANLLCKQLSDGIVPASSQDEVNTNTEVAGNDDLDGLFAPRRSSVRGVDTAGRVLTRPQKHVMADVMKSIKAAPMEWFPSVGNSETDDDVPRSARSDHTGTSRASKRPGSTHGVHDLEGMSDISGPNHKEPLVFPFHGTPGRTHTPCASARQGSFDFVVPRGNSSNGSGSARSTGSGGVREVDRGKPGWQANNNFDFLVPRSGTSEGSGSARSDASRARVRDRGELDIVVKRGGASNHSNSARSGVDKSPVCDYPDNSSDFVVARGSKRGEPPSNRTGPEAAERNAQHKATVRSPRSESAGPTAAERTQSSVENSHPDQSACRDETAYTAEASNDRDEQEEKQVKMCTKSGDGEKVDTKQQPSQFSQVPTKSPATDGAKDVRTGQTHPQQLTQVATKLSRVPGTKSKNTVLDGQSGGGMRQLSSGSAEVAQEGMPLVGGREKLTKNAFAHAAPRSAPAVEAPAKRLPNGGVVPVELSAAKIGRVLARIAVPVDPSSSRPQAAKELDTMSQASSAASECGWIDLFEDEDAGRRLKKRAQHDQKKDRKESLKSTTAADATMLRDFFCEGEFCEQGNVEALQRPRIKRSPSKAKFAKAIRSCGDVAPEKWDDNWKQMLHLQYEQGQKHFAVRGARAVATNSVEAAAAFKDGLDGIKRKFDKVGAAAMEGVRHKAEKAEQFRKTLAEEGVTRMLQTSNFGRRCLYGLEDEESSIYDLDELQELGEAEAALLDAIGAAEDPDDTAAPQDQEAVVSQPLHVELTAARLEALSTRLASRRDQKRRVKVL